MFEFFNIPEAVQEAYEVAAIVTALFLILFSLYEIISGQTQGGKKTWNDWAMSGISLGFLAAFQRPVLTVVVFLLMAWLFPAYNGAMAWLETQYFWPTLIIFLLVDEYLHGRTHLFAHSRKPKNRLLGKVQGFYKAAHRPHHLVGGQDNRGEVSASQTFVENWAWWLILPNYWFGLACLYLGLYEVFLWGSLSKVVWGMHVHTNWKWQYDLWLLNHRNSFVRKSMRALCHIFVFPNMHHHHHSRSANSAKNMASFFSIFDWLLWGTLKIETERPEVYGWRQYDTESASVLHRFFRSTEPLKDPHRGENASAHASQK